MKRLTIEGTKSSPTIDFDPDRHYLLIQGESRPEEVQNFYLPLLEWLSNYGNHVQYLGDKSSHPIEVNFNFKLEYFNSSSAKYMMDIVKKLGKIDSESDKVNVTINWHYEELDEDVFDAGKELQELVGVNFKFIPID